MNKIIFSTVTPESVGVSSQAVLNFIKTLDDYRMHTHSIIMARGEKIFAEAYYKPFDENFLHRMYSSSKTFVAIAVGAAITEGLMSLDDVIIEIAKKVGFKYHSTIIWNEGNISKSSAWGSWMSASCPYVIAPVELIVLLYKGEWKKRSGSKQSDITRNEFISWTNGVWTFKGESKRKIGHPAPFPVELPKRCIKLFSYVGDTILDPFMGSGSTVIAAKQNNRHGIGIDFEIDYCQLAMERILKETK